MFLGTSNPAMFPKVYKPENIVFSKIILWGQAIFTILWDARVSDTSKSWQRNYSEYDAWE
jgi:hypothetical protein